VVSFANQLADRSLRAAVADYHRRAEGKALIDYAFHIILSDVSQAVMGQEMPALMQDGYRSFKVFMTYPGYMLDDGKILDVMETARRHDGTVLVHAENGHCIHWLTQRLEVEGRTGLAAFPDSAPAAVEREATHRAITLAELSGARVMLVHVSSVQAMEQIEWARARGLTAMAETCPQYLLDQAERFHDHGWEPAKIMCSPPPRGGDNAGRLWSGVARGIFHLLSSDHCPYRFDGADGKRSQMKAHGDRLDFRHVPPGVPGLETRLPLLYSEGVMKGRITPQQFVALTATNPARAYGLYPRKGTLAPGSDADISLWNAQVPRTIRHADLHDACDYSPYEGWEVGAWPTMTLSRGEVVFDRGWIADRLGRGKFLKQSPHS
jgi:dihydropyrimidinase